MPHAYLVSFQVRFFKDILVIPVVVDNTLRTCPCSDEPVTWAISRRPDDQRKIARHEMWQLSVATTIPAPLAASSHPIRGIFPQGLLDFPHLVGHAAGAMSPPGGASGGVRGVPLSG